MSAKEIWYRPYLAHSLVILVPTAVRSGGTQSMLAGLIFCFLCVRCGHAIRLPYGVTRQREKFSLSAATTTATPVV